MEEKKIKDKNLFFANQINIILTFNNIKNLRKSKVNLKYTERKKKRNIPTPKCFEILAKLC